MLALPVARPGTEARGWGGGGEKQRNREDKRQLSEHHVPTTEAALTTHPATSTLQAPLAQADPAAPRDDSQGMSL